MPSLVRTPEEFRIWKKRRRASNRELAMLTGRSPSTIDRKLNGRTAISLGMSIGLANIDRLIAAGLEPENCPDNMRALIAQRRLR